MMKRFLLFVWILVFFVCAISAEKVIPLPSLTKPGTMAVDESQIYVTQGAQIFIFDKKDGKLKKEFGKEGEGPREFKTIPQNPQLFNVIPREKDLFINSLGKISFYSKDGNFIDEKKNPGGLFSSLLFRPFDNKYIGISLENIDKQYFYLICIFNDKMEKEKELTRILYISKDQKIQLIRQSIDYCVFKNKIYVTGAEGLLIDVFDKAGKKLFSFKEPYETVKFTSEDKDKAFESLKKMYGAQADAIKNNIDYPDNWPVMFKIDASGDYFYVLTWKSDKGKNELYVFNPEGKLVKKVWIPFDSISVFQPFPFSIYNKQFYQLVENDETEECELKINDILN